MSNNKIKVNFFIAVIVGGVVKANYYANSLAVIPDLKLDFPGCELEVYDVSRYGLDFGNAPTIKVEGGQMLHRVRCRETGKTWDSVKECCKELGLSLKTLYTALRRGSRIYGFTYDYFD